MDRTLRLYQLQQLDNEEQNARARLAEIEDALGDTPALKRARQEQKTTAENTRHAATQQKDLELQVGTLKQKIGDSEKQLYSGSIRNPKELSDRQAELQSLRRRLEGTEEKLLEAMIARDDADAKAQQAQAVLEQTERDWAADQGGLVEERQDLETRLQEIDNSRNQLLGKISAKDLDVYNKLRKSKGDLIVVSVRSGACTGCAMEIPSARLQLVGRDELVSCGNCERLLLPEGRI